MKLDHAKKNGIYCVNTHISHQDKNLIEQKTSNATGLYNSLKNKRVWVNLYGKLNLLEVKEWSTEAVTRKEQTVPTYE